MDDLWFNILNFFGGKGEVKGYPPCYERDVIQPHAFGKFRALVAATAQSPAMLFYLDNFLSADPNAAQRQAAERAMRQQMRRRPYGYPPRPQPQQTQNNKQHRGLTENYGTQLMSLHPPDVERSHPPKHLD